MIRIRDAYVDDMCMDRYGTATATVVLNEVHILKEIRKKLSPGEIPGDIDRAAALDVLIRSFEKRVKE